MKMFLTHKREFYCFIKFLFMHTIAPIIHICLSHSHALDNFCDALIDGLLEFFGTERFRSQTVSLFLQETPPVDVFQLIEFFLLIPNQLTIHNQPASEKEEKHKTWCGSFELVVDCPVGVHVEDFEREQQNIGEILQDPNCLLWEQGQRQGKNDATQNLHDSNRSPVPFGRKFDVQHLGKGEHLSILGILRPEILVQVLAQPWSYLQNAQEYEKGSEEHREALQYYLGHFERVI